MIYYFPLLVQSISHVKRSNIAHNHLKQMSRCQGRLAFHPFIPFIVTTNKQQPTSPTPLPFISVLFRPQACSGMKLLVLFWAYCCILDWLVTFTLERSMGETVVTILFMRFNFRGPRGWRYGQNKDLAVRQPQTSRSPVTCNQNESKKKHSKESINGTT